MQGPLVRPGCWAGDETVLGLITRPPVLPLAIPATDGVLVRRVLAAFLERGCSSRPLRLVLVGTESLESVQGRERLQFLDNSCLFLTLACPGARTLRKPTRLSADKMSLGATLHRISSKPTPGGSQGPGNELLALGLMLLTCTFPIVRLWLVPSSCGLVHSSGLPPNRPLGDISMSIRIFFVIDEACGCLRRRVSCHCHNKPRPSPKTLPSGQAERLRRGSVIVVSGARVTTWPCHRCGFVSHLVVSSNTELVSVALPQAQYQRPSFLGPLRRPYQRVG
jgi:hypothetical protein